MSELELHEPNSSDLPTDFWNRPAGVAETLRVALPLMISTGCLTLTLFADRTLLLWSSQDEMAASMASGNLFWLLVCLPVGIVSMTSAFVAQYSAARQPENIGRMIWQAVWFSLAISPIYWVMIPAARLLFETSGQSEALVGLETIYLQILLVGATAAILDAAFAGLFSGTDRNAVVMWVNVASSIVNIVLDAVLIFGLAGLPELGIVGAGIATVSAFWLKVFIYAWLMWRPESRKLYALSSRWRPSLEESRRLLFFGLPAGLQYVTESGAFAVIILQVGQISTEALAATTMAINFNMAAFVPLIGVSIAASVLVGKHLVESGPKLAARAALSATTIGMTYAAAWALIYVVFPNQLLSLYTVGTTTETIDSAIGTAATLLKFVAAYCIFDAAQIIIAGALRGAGDTWFVLLASFSTASFWVLVGLLAENSASSQLYWWWWMCALWIFSLSVAMLSRFLHGRWREIRMIDIE